MVFLSKYVNFLATIFWGRTSGAQVHIISALIVIVKIQFMTYPVSIVR